MSDDSIRTTLISFDHAWAILAARDYALDNGSQAESDSPGMARS